MSAESRNSPGLPAPRWLTRAEKAQLRAIEKLRSDGGKPVLAAELDAICDYVSARSRLADLRKIYRRAARDLREDPESDGAADRLCSIARQIDTAGSHARRLGRVIGLVG